MTIDPIARFVTVIVVAAIVIACSDEPVDPFSEEAVRRDLDERPVAELYEAAEARSYTPPEHGRISRPQLEAYLRVTRLADTIAAVASRRLSDQADEASKETDRFARIATTFSAIGSARAAGTAELRAALTLGVNPHEYAWVDSRVATVLRLAKERARLEEAIDRAKNVPHASTYAEDALRDWKERVPDADASNAKLIEPHREALARRHAF